MYVHTHLYIEHINNFEGDSHGQRTFHLWNAAGHTRPPARGGPVWDAERGTIDDTRELPEIKLTPPCTRRGSRGPEGLLSLSHRHRSDRPAGPRGLCSMWLVLPAVSVSPRPRQSPWSPCLRPRRAAFQRMIRSLRRGENRSSHLSRFSSS